MVSHYLITFFIQCILVTLQLLQRFSITKSKKRIKHHTDIQNFFQCFPPSNNSLQYVTIKIRGEKIYSPLYVMLVFPRCKTTNKRIDPSNQNSSQLFIFFFLRSNCIRVFWFHLKLQSSIHLAITYNAQNTSDKRFTCQGGGSGYYIKTME